MAIYSDSCVPRLAYVGWLSEVAHVLSLAKRLQISLGNASATKDPATPYVEWSGRLFVAHSACLLLARRGHGCAHLSDEVGRGKRAEKCCAMGGRDRPGHDSRGLDALQDDAAGTAFASAPI